MARKIGIVQPHDLAVAVALAAGEEPPPPPPEPRLGKAPNVLPPETDEILAAITATVQPLEDGEAMVRRMSLARGRLYTRGRDLGIPSRLMADAAGISEQAVGKAIKKAGRDAAYEVALAEWIAANPEEAAAQGYT